MKYPMYAVLAWIENTSAENGYDLILLKAFDNEDDAVRHYRQTRITHKTHEVIVQKITKGNYENILRKNETGEVLNRL